MKTIAICLSAALLALSCTGPAPGNSTPELTPLCIEVAGRQGIAADSLYYYVSSSTALYKYEKDGTLILSNETPFDSLELPANHFGDIDVHDGDIYTGIETFIDGVGQNIQVAVYDAQTLQYKYSIPWNQASGQVECCGLAVDPEHGKVWMADWVQGHELYCYDLQTKEYCGKVRLDPAPRLQQGIAYHCGKMFISCDDGDADKSEHDHIYVTDVYDADGQILDLAHPVLWREMSGFRRDGEIEGLTFDGSTGDFIVLSNRGARIILGMPKGFYEGYDREIHEIYIYGTHARHSEQSAHILTPKAPDTPRINGPRVYGNKPGTPFLFKIPATGLRPLTYKAEGLPRGLKLDPATGIITGRVNRRGEWTVKLTASNILGSDTRELRIEIGDRLCLTPPMGWNSWNCWRMTVSEEKVKSSVDALIEKGLDQYGWSYVNVDDGWQMARGGRYNAIQPNDKFPDMKGLSDYVHERGLKFGIYSSPWAMCPGGTIGSTATNPEGRAWWVDMEGRAGEYGRYVPDPEDAKRYSNPWEAVRFHGKYMFVNEDARQWADWGVDFLKYDWHPLDHFNIKMMHDALSSTGRSIAYSLSNRAPIGLGADLVGLANAWRTSSDIRDQWEHIYRIGFTIMDRWAAYTGPGHWPDADMLEIGAVSDFARGEGYTRDCRLTADEQYTHVTLWAILCSPLLIGCDLAQIDDFTLSLLTNSEVIDVNQDPLGYPAARVEDDGNGIVYHKPLEDGSLVIALFNVSDEPRKMGFQIGALNYMMVETQTVRDLWSQKDIAVLHPGEKFEGDRLDLDVAPHGCRLIKLSPGMNPKQKMWW